MNDSVNSRDNNAGEYKSYNTGDNGFEGGHVQTQKTIHPKIFTTTVMEKKKNINFKVIKNKEKEAAGSNGNSQNCIKNNFEKNNNKIINKNNDYYQEDGTNGRGDKIFQNAILGENKSEYQDYNNRNFIDSFLPYNLNKMKMNSNVPSSHINLLGPQINAGSNFNVNVRFHSGNSSFQISNRPQFSHFPPYAHQFNPMNHGMHPHSHPQYHPQPPLSPKKKLKQRETFNYIEVLINAADKIYKQGLCVFENETMEMNVINSALSVSENEEEHEGPVTMTLNMPAKKNSEEREREREDTSFNAFNERRDSKDFKDMREKMEMKDKFEAKERFGSFYESNEKVDKKDGSESEHFHKVNSSSSVSSINTGNNCGSSGHCKDNNNNNSNREINTSNNNNGNNSNSSKNFLSGKI
jgi:hypothetical protein